MCLGSVMVVLWMEEEVMEEEGDVAHSTDGQPIGRQTVIVRQQLYAKFRL